MPTKLVTLTADEAAARDRAIDFYRFIGKPAGEIDRLAWSDVQLAFPRLQAFASAPKASAMAAGADAHRAATKR